MANEELIMHAREFLATPNLGRDMARELNKALTYMWELADIAEAAEARVKELEAKHPEGWSNEDAHAAFEEALTRWGGADEQAVHNRNGFRLGAEWQKARETFISYKAIADEAKARIAELESGEWQYSYFEKWVDGSGVYERVTFRTLAEARKYFDNSGDMSGWNAEVEKKDRLVAGIEKRRVVEPGTWVPVESEEVTDD